MKHRFVLYELQKFSNIYEIFSFSADISLPADRAG